MFTFKPNTAEQKDVENTKLADRKVLRPLSLTGASSPLSGGIRTSV